MKLSIIIPVLNEADEITDCLTALKPLRRNGHEVIVVDGGSRDETVSLAEPLCDRCLAGSERGRAAQMNEGAAVAKGDILLFLHADTRLPLEAEDVLIHSADEGYFWGRFDVRLSGQHPLLRVVETAMNLRSRVTGIATGDQAMFVSRALFDRVGGFPAVPLMEDIALSKTLKQLRPPHCLRHRVITSSRRWQEKGLLRTILTMWKLRLMYFLGVSPAKLARRYED
ncbi:MAG: TIGR04283 family arsenosugar biosynthesis glycosyltransferase [Gammaproteobacteria bacterium]